MRRYPSKDGGAIELVALLVACAACQQGSASGVAEREPQAARGLNPSTERSTRPVAAPAKPPTAEYVAASPWHPRDEPGEAVAPPDPAQETWRVKVHRHAPMQTQTPRWQALPAEQNATVEMRPDSAFGCLVTPLSVEAESDDFGTRLEAWVLRRELRCSSDGWRTWSAYPHVVRIEPDGTRASSETRALLRALAPPGDTVATRETLVLLRDGPEQREATRGPPKVLARTQPGAED